MPNLKQLLFFYLIITPNIGKSCAKNKDVLYFSFFCKLCRKEWERIEMHKPKFFEQNDTNIYNADK